MQVPSLWCVLNVANKNHEPRQSVLETGCSVELLGLLPIILTEFWNSSDMESNNKAPWFNAADLHAGWWFGAWFIFPYIGNNHPNWQTHIFQTGRYTTNQHGFTTLTIIFPRYIVHHFPDELSMFHSQWDFKARIPICSSMYDFFYRYLPHKWSSLVDH